MKIMNSVLRPFGMVSKGEGINSRGYRVAMNGARLVRVEGDDERLYKR